MNTNEYTLIDEKTQKYRRKDGLGGIKYYVKTKCAICKKELYRRFQDYRRHPEMQPVCHDGECKAKLWQKKLKKPREINKEYIVDDNTIRIWSGRSWLYKTKIKCSECGAELYRDRGDRFEYNFCSDKCAYRHSDPIGADILTKTNLPEFSYLLGLIATDGCVSSSGSTVFISLTLHDHKILKTIQKTFGGRVNYSIRNRQDTTLRSQLYSWSINNMEFRNYLISIGITNKKSLTLDIDALFNSMSEENKWHFIRGCLEGDGSFGARKNGNSIYFGFVSGSEKFITTINNFIGNYCGVNSGIRQDNRGKNTSYTFEFGAKVSDKILERMYKNCGEFYIQRKFNGIKHKLGINEKSKLEEILEPYPKSKDCKHYYYGMNLYIPKESRGVLLDFGFTSDERAAILEEYKTMGVKLEIIQNSVDIQS